MRYRITYRMQDSESPASHGGSYAFECKLVSDLMEEVERKMTYMMLTHMGWIITDFSIEMQDED